MVADSVSVIADCSAYKVPVELSLVGGDAPLGPVQGIDLFLGRSSVGVSGGTGASHGHSPSGRGGRTFAASYCVVALPGCVKSSMQSVINPLLLYEFASLGKVTKKVDSIPIFGQLPL